MPACHVIPRNSSPVGIVTEVKDYLVGEDEYQARMIIVYVRWSDPRWNVCGGVSEESTCDLFLIQDPTPDDKEDPS